MAKKNAKQAAMKASNKRDASPSAAKPKLASSSSTAIPVEGQKTSEELWFIHGEFYDLAPFFPNHPGGATILGLAKGEISLWELCKQTLC
jgi:cytochrome b involved in lipid metabolism